MASSAWKTALALAAIATSIFVPVVQHIANSPLHGNTAYGEPDQNDNAGSAAFQRDAFRITPVAAFKVRARVLAREDYRWGREADLSPMDLALGWNRMSEEAVLARLDISQGGRFYLYRWRDSPPIPPEEIAANSANMHLIPADELVSRILRTVRVGAVVTLEGALVDVDALDGWHWRTSRTRHDTGAGACEIVLVRRVAIEKRTAAIPGERQ